MNLSVGSRVVSKQSYWRVKGKLVPVPPLIQPGTLGTVEQTILPGLVMVRWDDGTLTEESDAVLGGAEG